MAQEQQNMDRTWVPGAAEYLFTAVANFIAAVAVIALVAGALFYLRDLSNALDPRAHVPDWVLWLSLVGIVATQRLRARRDEIPLWFLYVIFLAGAVAFRLDFELKGAGVGRWIMFAGVFGLWIVADALTQRCTMSATDKDTSDAGLLCDEGGPGETVREVKILQHPGAGVILFAGATIVMLVVCRPLMGEGVLGETAWTLKLAMVAGLVLLALTAMFAYVRHVHKRRIACSGAFIPIWLVAAFAMIAFAVGVAAIAPVTDLRVRDAVVRFAGRKSTGPARVPAGGDPRSDQPGRQPGRADPDDPDRNKTGRSDPDGRGSRSGPERQNRQAPTDDARSSRKGAGEQEGQGQRGERRPPAQQPPSRPPGGQALSALISALRPIVYVVIAVVALVAGIVLARRLARELSNSKGWRGRLARLLNRLFSRFTGWWDALRSAFAGAGPSSRARRRRNPFLSDRVFRRGDLEAAVRYAYEQARAVLDEEGLASRQLAPYELLANLDARLAPFEEDLGRLTDLYVVAAYSGQRLKQAAWSDLERIWPRLAEMVVAVRGVDEPVPRASGEAAPAA